MQRFSQFRALIPAMLKLLKNITEQPLWENSIVKRTSAANIEPINASPKVGQ